MIEKVKDTIDRYDMIVPGAKVIVALSGGSDSVCLLHCLYSLKEKYGISIEAAHVNHCLRGGDADSDEEFVRDLCARLEIPLSVLRADVSGYACEQGMTVEEAGRKIRYDYFREVAGGGLIATAHNLNDRLETFLFNFSRGSALKGLCSIPPVRDGIIRPLIECTKDEINAYCESNSLGYVTDKTNQCVDYSRNRIRHNVIPELKIINNSLEKSALRCIDSLNEDEKYLSSLADELIRSAAVEGGYSIDRLASSALPVRKRALARILKKVTGGDIDALSVKETDFIISRYKRDNSGKTVQLSGGMFARTRAGLLEFIRASVKSVPDETFLKEGITLFSDYMIAVSVTDINDYNSQFVSKDFSGFFGDCDKILGELKVRGRKSGDCIRFSSRGITKPLRKIQNENKIPPEVRETLPVISDDNGVLCAYRCGIDSRFIVTDKTKRVIIIRIEECVKS